MAEAQNHAILEGELLQPPEVRHSPAGVPIARFLLSHRSVRPENGVDRPIALQVGVRVAGPALVRALDGVAPGTGLRVTGYLARPRLREGDTRLIIAASRIERLDGIGNN